MQVVAEAGCGAFRIMDINGHQSLAEVQTDIACVNKPKLAHEAMNSLPKMTRREQPWNANLLSYMPG